MQRQELLIVKRHHADRIVWEPRQDFLVGIKRALRVGGRDYALSRAFEVSATAIAVDDTATTSRSMPIFESQRRWRPAQSGGELVLRGRPRPFASRDARRSADRAGADRGAPDQSAWPGARDAQRVVTRAQLALEQLLDRLERGESPARRRGLAARARSSPRRRDSVGGSDRCCPVIFIC